MVALACMNLMKVSQNHPSPPFSRIAGLPNLFGVCVYSFMCHHSLPSLVTPINNKQRLYTLILGDYLLILAFYCLLAFTGIFAFREINDLYTLNFQVKLYLYKQIQYIYYKFFISESFEITVNNGRLSHSVFDYCLKFVVLPCP